MKFIFVFNILIVLCLDLSGQNQSFIKQFDSAASLRGITFENSEEIIVVLTEQSINSEFFFVDRLVDGTSTLSYRVNIDNTYGALIFGVNITDNVLRLATNSFNSPGAEPGLKFLIFNLETGVSQVKYLNIPSATVSYGCRFTTDNSGNTNIAIANSFFVNDNNSESFIELHQLSETGVNSINKGLCIYCEEGYDFTSPALTQILTNTTEESLYISGFSSTVSSTEQASWIINTTNNNFGIIKKRSFPFHEMTSLVKDSQDNLYWLGKTSEVYPFTNNEENSILLKLNSDLEVQWARVYHADNFEYSNSALEIMPNGNLILSYSTFGAFPTVLATLDSEGNILDEKGYPFYNPEVYVLPDGSLLLQTNQDFDEEGNVSFTQIIAKTDINGDFENCETYPACLQANDVSVELEDFPITVIDEIDELEDRNATVEPYEFNYTDYCNTVPPPSPQFFVPDTIWTDCCFRPTNLYNHFAHDIKWSISRDTFSQEWSDSLSVEFCLEIPGTYIVEQTVRFLGCEYFEQHSVTVIPAPGLIEQSEDFICTEPPYQLNIEGTDTSCNYLWNNGATDSSITAYSGGNYSVNISDDYCQTEDSVLLRFLSDSITPPYLNLPSDTLLCRQSLPFSLQVQSNWSESFSLESGFTETNNNFDLQAEGIFSVYTQIENCIFSEDFTLSTKSCNTVYLPNAFSPDFDGINDTFKPEGQYFEPILLSIYDRWGNLLYNSNLCEWTGENAGQGSYIYVFEFFNVLTGKNEILSGDLLLIK